LPPCYFLSITYDRASDGACPVRHGLDSDRPSLTLPQHEAIRFCDARSRRKVGRFGRRTRGSLTSLSNPAGALAQTYTFDSFGKQTASSGSLTSTFQHTGRESDAETGLYHYRARYYDPATGRFLSEDPIQFAAGENFYRYVDNNPTFWRDASGLLPGGGLPVAVLVPSIVLPGRQKLGGNLDPLDFGKGTERVSRSYGRKRCRRCSGMRITKKEIN
jgi:RHS repeat-associated protein